MHIAIKSAAVSLLLSLVPLASSLAQADTGAPLIRRTEYGVPHIKATSFRGIGVGLGYAMSEDYGERVLRVLLRNKGWMGRVFGADSMGGDWNAVTAMRRVQETYHLLDADTRAVYEGFADGVNRWIRANRQTLPEWAEPTFTGHDVAAGDIGQANVTAAQRLVLRRLRADSQGRTPSRDEDMPDYSEDGSNAWALAPSRTTSGRAILLRNPHLSWTAGYWEAHVTVPGRLDFYGDFRIGGPFGVIAGFNRDLGWATTNNATDLDEVYALDVDPVDSVRYLFDGVSQLMRAESLSVWVRGPQGLEQRHRVQWSTPLGPVVHRTAHTIYVVRAGPAGEYRGGQQFLAMMRARSLREWKTALAMRARATSNLTYADRAGNIFTIWMASLPSLPHVATGDSLFTRARTSADIWTTLVPLDSLPQFLNPRGGYVHNENDPPHFGNLRAVLDSSRFPANVERGAFDLRSQLAVQLIGGSDKLSLQEVMRRKHSYRMLLADRVKPDLLRALRRDSSVAALRAVVPLLARWDNRASAESRGSTLFETWWRIYSGMARDSAFAEPWSWSRLAATPRGIGRPDLVRPSILAAIDSMQSRWGAVDVAWGAVHRVRRGAVDVPVGGCSGALGCFRVLGFERARDGKLVANTGDGWVLAVEFGAARPRAYSVLAYGQSDNPASPHHADQAEMFARGMYKPVWWTEAEIRQHTQRSYRPE